jgi:hypothetical protein
MHGARDRQTGGGPGHHGGCGGRFFEAAQNLQVTLC